MNPAVGSVTVQVQRLDHASDLPLPVYQTAGSAGLDLTAAIGAPVVLDPGARAAIPTGLVIGLPDGFEGQIRPRSGLALKDGLTVLNAPGTVDADYRGELKVILVNLGAERRTVERGQRIAQLVVAPVTRIAWAERPFPASDDAGGRGAAVSARRGDDDAAPFQQAALRHRGGGRHRLQFRRPAGAILGDHAAAGDPAPLSGAGAAAAGARRHPLRRARSPRGYRLARERRRVTLGEVVRVLTANAEDEEAEAAGAELGKEVVRPLWAELQNDLMARIDALTIEDLCDRARKAGIASENENTIDFTI